MACMIFYRERPDLGVISMSNGLTAVVASVLALSASAEATTDHEREIAAWFAAHDQAICGLGGCDIELGALPWGRGAVESDRAFVLRAIASARNKLGWDRLGYSPREDWVESTLGGFAALVRAFDPAHVGAPWRGREWMRPASLERCPRHDVYRHEKGCLLCDDV